MNSKTEIKRINNMCVQDILSDRNALEMLKTFLQKYSSGGDKALIKLYIELYEKCKEYLNHSNGILKEQFEELCDLGLPYEIEYGKLDMITRGDTKDCIHLIMDQLIKNIEIQKEYDQFRRQLAQNIN